MRKLLLLGTALWATVAGARVTLPAHFTHNMVLQQQRTLTIRGTAKAGSAVTLTTTWGKSAAATAQADGSFTLQVQTPKASLKPQTLTFSDGEETRLDNVLIGEVWLGSGQSNMEMPLAGWGKVLNYEQEIADAQYPMIRLLQVKKVTAIAPQRDITPTMGGWQECSPQTVPEFSALCYFYALRLWEELKVPIGVIDDDWGGTPCESWIRSEALADVMGFRDQMQMLRRLGDDVEAIRREYSFDTWNSRVEAVDPGTSGKEMWYAADYNDAAWRTMEQPVSWEMTDVSNFDGIMWFRRTIDIPAEWAGKDLRLELGIIDDLDVTYWNGEKVGETFEFFQAANYTIPGRLVQAGKNVIAVRALDTGGTGGFVAKKGEMHVRLDDQQRISLDGAWRYHKGADLGTLPLKPIDITNQNHPTVLYNAMIHPLVGFPLRGFIWYQGCSNVGRAEQHEALFQTLITDWRRLWGQPDMPFYFVQLANFMQHFDVQPVSDWALLRESQEAALALPHTGMAVNIDLGDAGDIHPKTKRELARRLSAIALHQTYGRKKVPYTAPTYSHYTIDGYTARLHFAQVKGGETLVQDADLPGFIVKGTDGVWRKATARVTGPLEVEVTAVGSGLPVAIRYGWADNPTCTLRTASGLHVAPFRTDK
ncbi:MAG: 9-O-acetylesterase [Bacteroidaceae bacterium]|nr:9-O-acetylesterase [Bacteroidaceae bacterium]